METANRRCTSPLPDSEVATIAESIARYAPAKSFGDEPVSEFPDEVDSNPTQFVKPTLSEIAYYGLAGAIIKKLEPHTEAHPAGLLIEFLISFGNIVGRGPYYQVEDTKHFTNEFAVIVGETSRARKGTGKQRIRAIMQRVDSEWLLTRSVSGVGSGEKIIHLVRDAETKWIVSKKTGEGSYVKIDDGVADKRLCVNLGEFQGILQACHRADSLMSVVLRDSWDGVPLHNLVKTDPASCKEGLISILFFGWLHWDELKTSYKWVTRTPVVNAPPSPPLKPSPKPLAPSSTVMRPFSVRATSLVTNGVLALWALDNDADHLGDFCKVPMLAEV